MRCWALPIDKGVVDKIHKHTEVDRLSIPVARGASLEDRSSALCIREPILHVGSGHRRFVHQLQPTGPFIMTGDAELSLVPIVSPSVTTCSG